MRRLALKQPINNQEPKPMINTNEDNAPKSGTCCSTLLVVSAIISGIGALILLRLNIGDQNTLLILMCYSWLTMLSTGIGSLPFYFFTDLSSIWIGLSNAMAAGMMIAASIALVVEGYLESSFSAETDGWKSAPVRLTAGCVLGVAFMFLVDWALGDHDLQFHHLRGATARKALLILAAMTFHSVAEGIAIGVSFSGQGNLGFVISSALGVHNVPEGLTVCLALVPQGVAPTDGTLWSIFSSFPQPLLAVPVFLFVENFLLVVAVGLGFAAGAMTTVAVKELIPEALEVTSKPVTFGVALLSGIAMAAFQMYFK